MQSTHRNNMIYMTLTEIHKGNITYETEAANKRVQNIVIWTETEHAEA